DAAPGEKPKGIKTHLRNMLIVPEMIGSIVGIYNGQCAFPGGDCLAKGIPPVSHSRKSMNGVEIKPEMVGHYLGEFSITYKPVRHGRPGIGSTNSSRFIPLN
ncbi:unnamed protein product, partial [Ectocarpus sp. 12 AP-2014]